MRVLVKMSLHLHCAQKPSFAEFRNSIDVAELYLSYENDSNSDEMYSLIQQIQTFVLTDPSKQKQTNIKDYFKS